MHGWPSFNRQVSATLRDKNILVGEGRELFLFPLVIYHSDDEQNKTDSVKEELYIGRGYGSDLVAENGLQRFGGIDKNGTDDTKGAEEERGK